MALGVAVEEESSENADNKVSKEIDNGELSLLEDLDFPLLWDLDDFPLLDDFKDLVDCKDFDLADFELEALPLCMCENI